MIEKLKESGNLTRSLEIECDNLKDVLNRSQLKQTNLTTSCLILIGIIKPLLKSNADLKSQRDALNKIYFSWYQTQFKLKLNWPTNKISHKPVRNGFDSENAIDYSLSASLATEESNFDSTADSNEYENNCLQKHSNTKLGISKLGLFRKTVILVLAAHRIILIHNEIKNSKLFINKSSPNLNCRQFIYSDSPAKSVEKNSIRGSLINENTQLNKLIEVANDLNLHLLNDQYCKQIKTFP